jgi:predicted dehydrogenase
MIQDHPGATPSRPSRRDFIKTSTSTALATAAITSQTIPAFAAENTTIRVGLVGCGGRGSGAAQQALAADPNTKLVALGDTFPDQVTNALAKFKDSKFKGQVDVRGANQFSGFDAYKKVINSCDIVLLASPPAFRPKHLEYAVERGKHVFCEKPVAVDAPGVRSVIKTCKLAYTKNLNIVSGLCYRYQFAKQDILGRIHKGDIGDIIAMQTTYNTGTLWHRGKKPEWSDMEYQIRNWLYFDWLSGDHITEQHIHSLDKIAWAMNDEYPEMATASGGRIVRTDQKYGNIYDHFNTTYEWASGVKAFSSCRQWGNASTDVSDHIFGTKGTAHLQEHTIDYNNGKSWSHERKGLDDMYQNEHNALFAAIRKGDAINNGKYMCGSTLMAIMGRMSAYTGKTITWDEALNSNWKLTPDKLVWADHPINPVAQPGITKFT